MMERIIKVESRQERDDMTNVLIEMGYKIIDWRYHEDIFQREDGKIARIIDIRE